MKTLSDVQKASEIAFGLTAFDMVELASSILGEKLYSKEKVAEELGISIEQLESTLLTPNTRHLYEFKLGQRALHVFQEALRVKEFHRTCLESTGSNERALLTLGRLMAESHLSLKRLYECSHPRLDELVEASAEYVYGARLTGAGWGGCTVALVKNEKLHDYIEHLKETFYKKYYDGDDLDKFIFATAPMSGACIYE
nr:unnamed protein product [Callosobruchus analis]